MRVTAPLLTLLFFLFMATFAHAHGMRTGALRIDEVAPGHAFMHWQQTVPDASVEPEIPEGCTATPMNDLSDAKERATSLQCEHELAGMTFGVSGLGPIITEATILVTLHDGRTASHVVTAEAPRWQLPRIETAWEVARGYVRLGAIHIATGADHLIFLALLVLVLRRVRAVLLAETAFTLSHSISFSATALGWVHVAAPAAEACIALSLILLALDVNPDHPSKHPRRAAGAALVFGLVHGLGFASGLQELGLPDNHVAVALVGFGAGVEIGQIAFLAAVLAILYPLSRLRIFPRMVSASTLAAGSMAAFWFVQRIYVCLTAA